MRILITLLALAVTITTSAQQKVNKKPALKKPVKQVQPLTVIRAVKMQDVVNLIDSSTTPLIVNFWATWCGPCVEEIPYFEKIVAEHAKDSIKLILVSLDFNYDYKTGQLDKFVARQKYASEIIWLSENNADTICPMIDKKWDGNIPASLMINNKKGYRMFYPNQLREARFRLEVEALVK